MSWTRHLRSSRHSLGTNPAKEDQGAQTSLCWWPIMMTPQTRCLCSSQVGVHHSGAGLWLCLTAFSSLSVVFCFLPASEGGFHPGPALLQDCGSCPASPGNLPLSVPVHSLPLALSTSSQTPWLLSAIFCSFCLTPQAARKVSQERGCHPGRLPPGGVPKQPVSFNILAL